MKLARLILVLGASSFGGSAASTAYTSYTLRRGDTLSHVANKFKVPLVAVIAANDEIQDRVREGQLVRVPDPVAARVALARPIAASTAPAADDGSKSYRVVAGDTLGAIAKRFGTTVGELVRRNDLSGPNSLIREGKDLRLPPEADVPPAETPLCPVRGADKFSFSNSFAAPSEGRRQHGGNDMFARRGTPVVGPVDGVVRTVVGGRASFGFYIDGADGVLVAILKTRGVARAELSTKKRRAKSSVSSARSMAATARIAPARTSQLTDRRPIDDRTRSACFRPGSDDGDAYDGSEEPHEHASLTEERV